MKNYIKLSAVFSFAFALCANAQKIVIEPIDLFSNYRIVNPYVADSVLYFASDVKNSVVKTYVDQEGDHLFQLFKVELVNKLPYGTPKSYFSDPNRNVNQTALITHADNVYITQNNRDMKSQRGKVLGIYEQRKPIFGKPKGDGQLAVRQPRNSNVAYPSISPDGRYMVFASDMPGGEGSSDLYICHRQSDGKWGEPINMGARINTSRAETSPFIHASGKIFFASNGRDDSRKLDIYYTYRTSDGFATPVRFDVAINSIGDDYGFYYSDNEEWGYVTSNRHGTDRLYFFHQIFPDFGYGEEMVEENYCFTFFENSTENYDPSLFDFKWRFSDGAEVAGLEADHCFAGEGEYVVSLSVFDKTSQEELFAIAEYPIILTKPEQINIVFPERIHAGTRVEFSANANNITSFTPTTYYWTFSNGIKVKGQNTSMVFSTPGTYTVKVGTIADEDPSLQLCTWVEINVE